MHSHTLENWQHSYNFAGTHPTAEKRTQQVLGLTAITMVIEVVAGTMLGSMALLADGWHMGTHVAAFLIAMFAYRYARKHADSRRLSFGCYCFDPVMGIVVAVIITRWSIGLLKDTGPILLDASIDHDYADAIRETVERSDDNRVLDLHVWRVGADHYAAIVSVVTHTPKPAEHYKALLQDFRELSHLTIEVNRCEGRHCAERGA